MADNMKLTILSPERRLVAELKVDSVTLPGSEGQIQILAGHAAMIGTLHTGVLSYLPSGGGKEGVAVVSTGFFEIKDDTIVVMAETIETREEIDVERARRAQQRAEAALQEADLDEDKFRKHQLKLQRALIRQQTAAKSLH